VQASNAQFLSLEKFTVSAKIVAPYGALDEGFNSANGRENMKSVVQLYAIDTGTFINIPAEHTYLLSPNHIFNCFGRYEKGRCVRIARLSEKWASLVYGPDEKAQDCGTAAGLMIRYDGMCQNASNRILALADEDVDARGTNFNAVTTIMYGKYGFNVPQFEQRVKSTAEQLLDSNEITAAELEMVLKRIEYGQTPDAELDILHDDIKDQFKEQLPDITDEQRGICRPIYSEYQKQRQDIFTRLATNRGEEIGWIKLPNALREPWGKCVDRLAEALGEAGFENVLGVKPETAKGKLSGV
jgi:hypothetical protein